MDEVGVHTPSTAAFYEPPASTTTCAAPSDGRLREGDAGFRAMLRSSRRVLEPHRGTRYVAVMPYLANDLGAVGALWSATRTWSGLRARMWELARQTYSARRFFLQYQGRSCSGPTTIPNARCTRPRAELDPDEWFWRRGQRMGGLGMDLPTGVLRRIYRENASRVLPRSAVPLTSRAAPPEEAATERRAREPIADLVPPDDHDLDARTIEGRHRLTLST